MAARDRGDRRLLRQGRQSARVARVASHDDEDELFHVLSGSLRIEIDERTVLLVERAKSTPYRAA